jgi:hypothetical protein
MAENFCAHCGTPVAGAARFCANCGSPVGDDTAEKRQPDVGIRSGGIFDRLGIKLREPAGIRATRDQEEPSVWGVWPFDLERLLACSFMNAPLETGFLILEHQQQGWRRWLPLEHLTSLQGVKPMQSACVYYRIGKSAICPGVDDVYRTETPSGVDEAYVQCAASIHIAIEVSPQFSPVNYGELEKDIRGKWATLVFDQQMCKAVTAIPMPISGTAMKKRLLRHGKLLESWLGQAGDASLKKSLAALLENLRTALGEIPDGPADHALCLAEMMDGNKELSTATIDEEEQKQPVARADFPRVASLQAARVARPVSTRVLGGSTLRLGTLPRTPLKKVKSVASSR